MLEFSFENFEAISLSLKCLSMDMVQNAKSGHPGMPMGMADITAVLVSKYLKFTAHNPKWVARDRFIISNGHGSALQYAMLHLLGYEKFDLEQIKNFRQLHFNTHGHPEFYNFNGIETTTGPLGQGVANAVGMSIASKKIEAQHSDSNLNYNIFCFAGDGCMMEGITQEAISLAGHLKLNNLIVIYDNNQISIDGSTQLAFSDDTVARFESANWHVISIDGHDFKQIDNALQEAINSNISKPKLINARTKIACGAPTKEGLAASHGAPLGDDEIAKFKRNFNLQNTPFHVQPNTRQLWNQIAQKAHNQYLDWSKQNNIDFDKIQADNQHLVSEILPKLLESLAIAELYDEDTQQDGGIFEATRKSSESALNVIATSGCAIFGSADLTDSNCVKIVKYNAINSENYDGNFIHYGVREHAMAAIMNGIALSGLLPIGSTFLTFTDYMRPAIRLSCIMNLKVIYVATHDSIGLGEDGPTHQPVEHLASLRMIPNLCVLRPADAIETLIAYNIALRYNGPVLLAFSRQALPNIITDRNFNSYYEFGARIVSEYSKDEYAQFSHRVLIYSTGSEVSLALEVAAQLKKQNIMAVVVSILDYNKFIQERLDFENIFFEIPPQLTVAIEAACIGLWNQIIGLEGMFFGIDGFGASGKAKDLYDHFGLSADAISDSILKRFDLEIS